MNALNRLQSAVMFQAVESEEVASKFTERARTMVMFGVLVVAALASTAARAEGPLTPSNCAGVGATVGGLVGASTGRSDLRHAVGAALGALGGAVAGDYLCSPKPKDSSYDKAVNYGNQGQSSSSYAVSPQAPKQPLSLNERDFLDNQSRDAIDAKYAWKKALYQVDQARESGFGPGVQSALEGEAQARATFEQKRAVFATTVARLNNGSDGNAPRAVGRYLEISGALLELSTDARVSFELLQRRDEAAQEASPAYHAEADRVAALRNQRHS